jgi:hypothetical protein
MNRSRPGVFSFLAEWLETRRLLSNDTLASADVLGDLPGQLSFLDTLDHATDPADCRTFNLPRSAVFTARFSGVSAESEMLLIRDANGNGEVDASDPHFTALRPGTQDETISNTLPAGKYWVRTSVDSGATAYRLTLTADYAGNSLATALNLGVFTARQFFTDHVDSTDKLDIYKVTLQRNGRFTAVLSNLQADANLRIIHDANNNGMTDPGEVLVASAHTGTANESILETPLAAGQYYIAVDHAGGAGTNYSLRLGSDQAGNTLDTARDIGTLAGELSFTDLVSSADTVDFYRIHLGSNNNLQLVLAGNAANGTKVALINDVNGNKTIDSGDLLTEKTVSNLSPAIIRRDVSAGDNFYVRVQRGTVDTSYQLFTTFADAGNTLITAADLGDLAVTTTLSKNFSTGGTNDPREIFKFSLSSPRTVDFLISDLTGDMNLAVVVDVVNKNTIDPEEIWLKSNNTGTQIDEVTPTLPAGTYFLRLERNGAGVATGRLDVNSRPPGTLDDFAGNSPFTARSAGTLGSAEQSFIDFNEGGDLYRFDLAGLSRVDLRMDGLTADANLSLVQIPGADFSGQEVLITSSNNSGVLDEEILQTVAPGTYFLRVSGAATFYRVRLKVTEVDGAGADTATARNLGTLPTSATIFNERVGGPDIADVYKFSLNNFRRVTLNVDRLTTADVSLELLDASGNPFVTVDHPGTTNESTVQNLLPGTYFVRVKPVIGEGPYRITLSSVTGPDPAGETLGTARNLGTISLESPLLTFDEYVGPDDTSDIYKFSTSQGIHLVETLQNASNSLGRTLQIIRDANGDGQVQASEIFPSTVVDLVPGTYFARILRNSGFSNYRINLAASQIDNQTANNTRGTASNIGLLSDGDSLSRRGYVGADDTVDFFKVSVSFAAFTTNLKVVVEHLTGKVTVSLLEHDGTLITSKTSSSSLTIDHRNFGGDFFIKIQRNSGVNTIYDLTTSVAFV